MAPPAAHGRLDARSGGPSGQAEDQRDLEVRADLIGSIYSHIPRSSLGVLAGAATVSWGMWGQVAHELLLIWAAAIACVLLWRLTLYRAHRRDVRNLARVGHWERTWTLSTGVHGSVWGSAAFFMYVPGSAEYQALLLVALFAISTAAVPLVGRHLPSLYAFVLPVLCPVIARLALEGEAVRVFLAVISSLVMYGIFLFGRELNRTIRESVQRRYENIELIEQLTAQTARAETARREADRANRMKTRFLASASHDLRQPMHALGLFSDSLRRRLTDPADRGIADHVCASVATLENMFDALLDISRLEAGVIQPRSDRFALQALLDRVAADSAPEAAEKGLTLRVSGTRLAVRSDPILVERILRNLVSNAIRYTDRGKVLIGCRRSDRVVRVEVWDTGVGIPEDQQDRIFDEFYRGTDPAHRHGLGLGLATVRRLTDLMHANLSLRSTAGKGTVFGFELPRTTAEPSAARPVEQDSGTLAGLEDIVVLVIDDEETVLDAMREALGAWGCRMVGARSLSEALARLPECRRYPDAIVSDLRLAAGELGTDVVARIRHELGATVPALIVTGDTSARSLRLIESRGLPYLPKPVAADHLRLALDTLLARER